MVLGGTQQEAYPQLSQVLPEPALRLTVRLSSFLYQVPARLCTLPEKTLSERSAHNQSLFIFYNKEFFLRA